MKGKFYQRFADKKLKQGWTEERICDGTFAFLDQYNERRVYLVNYHGRTEGTWLYDLETLYLESMVEEI